MTLFAVTLFAAAATVLGWGTLSGAGTTGLPATSPFFTLSVTPTQDLVNGQTMTVTVTRTPAGTAAGYEIDEIGTGWCTADFQVPPGTNARSVVPTHAGLPPLEGPHAHCTTTAQPLNSSLLENVSISPPSNPTKNYPSVTATVEAETSDGTELWTGSTLVCNSSNPCSFVVAVYAWIGGVLQQPVFLSVPVTYLPTSANAQCGGAAPGQLTTVSPDRMAQQVTSWTIDACTSNAGSGKALSQNLSSGQGDGSSLDDFASGVADLAYSAVGYGAGATFTPPTDRPYVAIPIAINAVVLAHIEAAHVTNAAGASDVFGDYPALDITDAQAAELLGGGPDTTALKWGSALGNALVTENPSLGTGVYKYGSNFLITLNSSGNATKTTAGVVATALPDATTLFATSFFNNVVPGDMTSAVGGKPLGVVSEFGTAYPPFGVVPATGLDIFDKDLSPGVGEGFALTNAATAAATWGGMADFSLQTPDSIGSAAPTYVAPTTQSMQAAVSEMIPQPDGTLVPNSDSTAHNGVVAYPLTYVEYAIAPTQPLLNGNCTPRSKSQQDLTAWLNYITGPGQAELAKGFAPLTPALQAQARNAIAKVGTAAPTGPCAPETSPGTIKPPPSPNATSPSSTTSTPVGSAFGSSGSFGLGTSTPAFKTSGVVTPTTRAKTKTQRKTNGGRVPPLAADLSDFRHVSGPGWFASVLGILFLVLLLPSLALIASRRSRRQAIVGPTGGSAGPPRSPPGDAP